MHLCAVELITLSLLNQTDLVGQLPHFERGLWDHGSISELADLLIQPFKDSDLAKVDNSVAFCQNAECKSCRNARWFERRMVYCGRLKPLVHFDCVLKWNRGPSPWSPAGHRASVPWLTVIFGGLNITWHCRNEYSQQGAQALKAKSFFFPIHDIFPSSYCKGTSRRRPFSVLKMAPFLCGLVLAGLCKRSPNIINSIIDLVIWDWMSSMI